MKIKDILALNLEEDITNVIDLENLQEEELLSEIENYIVTEGLAEEFSKLTSLFTSNIKETGIWLSGFYGSGKSYLGKLWGYILSNPVIKGTPARERILQRFNGISDEYLIKNEIMGLYNQKFHVVTFDVAKQNTNRGLAFTLYSNFLKSLKLPENEHGILLYQLMIEDAELNTEQYIKNKLGIIWSDIRKKRLSYIKAIKDAYIQLNNSEHDYENVMATIRGEMDHFDANKLKDELSNYLDIINDEEIVFVFDEASEAINQKKFGLLDFEGISEALSSLGSKVWTMAIAQEKLDDVINNSNVSKSQLTKMTDRFKTKIHIESTEVDVIIRSRLLRKNDKGQNLLQDHYNEYSGSITDMAMLHGTGLSKTDTKDSYITYYPFYKYQFDLMQNFLFGTKGYASTKVSARGMIISTYDILKKEIQNLDLYSTVNAWQISNQAQPQPPVVLVNRYDNAEKILKESRYIISGRKLLETINFLTEAYIVPTTLSNIIKSFVSNVDDCYKIEKAIEHALTCLVESKILIFSNNTYRITSDIEQRLLDEMNDFVVQSYVKKKMAIDAYKKTTVVKTLGKITDSNIGYDFYITSDNDDELTTPQTKYLKLKIKSLYSISDDRTSDINSIKVDYQNDKDTIWLIPYNNKFAEIDAILDEIKRYNDIIEKYPDPNSEESKYIRDFASIKDVKQATLQSLIESSLQNGTSVYLFNANILDKDNWQNIVQKQQREVIHNVYTKCLSSQLSDSIAIKVIKENNGVKLHSYFSGADFEFFDKDGILVGDKLKVSEEVLLQMNNTFVDGDSLESALLKPPTGYIFGTVISTVAALMRGGKVIAKYNGKEKYSWKDDDVTTIFSNSREFRKASFKAITKSLTATQKNDIVSSLQQFDCKDRNGKNIDWNTNDYDLVTAIVTLANDYYKMVQNLRNSNKKFDTYYPEMKDEEKILSDYLGTVNDTNYIDKAEKYIENTDVFENSINHIKKVQHFMKDKQPLIEKWNSFIIDVQEEFEKSAKKNEVVDENIEEFKNLVKKSIIVNYQKLQNIYQKIKDEYYRLFSEEATKMTQRYKVLKEKSENILKEINKLPDRLNISAYRRVESTLQYSLKRIIENISIEDGTKDAKSKLTYSDVLSSIAVYTSKDSELDILENSLVYENPSHGDYGNNMPPQPIIKTYETKALTGEIVVNEYKSWLTKELRRVSQMKDTDIIKITNY